VRDITKRKRTEEALRISEEKFRRLSSVAFEGIAIHEKGKILDANQTLADMFGYELSEFIGKNALDFTAPESRELLLKHILSGYEKPYEAIGVRKDKSTFPVEIIGKSAAYQGRQVRVAALRDITERKRMEEALTEQMRRNEQILQTTMDGFILADTAGQVIDVNPAYCEMVGYSRAELLRMNIRELEGKFVPGEIEQRIKHMLKQGKDQFETKHRCKDGKIIDLEVSIVIMQSEQRPLVAAFVRDITERKRADKELRKSRERLLKAQKVARMGFLDWDLKTNKIYLSDEIYRLLGLKSQRVLTTPELIEQVVHPDDLDYVRKNLELARRGEIKYNIDHRVVQPNGNILWVQAQAELIRDTDGQPKTLLGTVVDITERKRAEEALQESRNMLRLVLDSIPVRVFWKDQNSVYLGCNRHFAKDTGLDSPEEIIGQNDFKLSWVEQAEMYRADDQQVMQSGVPKLNYQEPETRSDGTKVWLRTSKVPLKNLEGNIVGVMGCYEDITERKQADEALRRSEERYRNIFQTAPVSIWEEDLSQVKAAIDEVQTQGVTDFRKYLNEHPDFVQQCIQKIQILDVNYATLKIYEAKSKEELMKSLDKVFVPESFQIFKEELIAIAEGKTYFESEAITQTLKGKRLNILLALIFPADNVKFSNLLVSIMDITERKLAEEALRVSRERLQTLSHRLLEVQETERRTIARELHDEIGQTLTAVKINLQAIPRQTDPISVQKQIDESVSLIERALQQTRNLSLDLRPSLLDDLGLVPALRWYLDRHARRTGVVAIFAADKLTTRLQPELEIACFRIVQEALTNAAKYARAKQIWVELHKINQELQVVVRDNGIGFDVNAARESAAKGTSLGILGMEERVLLVAGKLEIKSSPGKGTEVHASFPLHISESPGENDDKSTLKNERN
ncbi:MAG: PAS domain S-box protein, partial [bacterium]